MSILYNASCIYFETRSIPLNCVYLNILLNETFYGEIGMSIFGSLGRPPCCEDRNVCYGLMSTHVWLVLLPADHTRRPTVVQSVPPAPLDRGTPRRGSEATGRKQGQKDRPDTFNLASQSCPAARINLSNVCNSGLISLTTFHPNSNSNSMEISFDSIVTIWSLESFAQATTAQIMACAKF